MSYHLKTGIIQGQCHEKRVAFYPEMLLKVKWTANDFFYSINLKISYYNLILNKIPNNFKN